MNNATISPPPWVLDFNLGRVEDRDGNIVCYLTGGATPQSKANGHAIEAALELREALELTLKRFFETEDGLCPECGCKLGVSVFCESCKTFLRAEAAIRKAKGE